MPGFPVGGGEPTPADNSAGSRFFDVIDFLGRSLPKVGKMDQPPPDYLVKGADYLLSQLGLSPGTKDEILLVTFGDGPPEVPIDNQASSALLSGAIDLAAQLAAQQAGQQVSASVVPTWKADP